MSTIDPTLAKKRANATPDEIVADLRSLLAITSPSVDAGDPPYGIVSACWLPAGTTDEPPHAITAPVHGGDATVPALLRKYLVITERECVRWIGTRRQTIRASRRARKLRRGWA